MKIALAALSLLAPCASATIITSTAQITEPTTVENFDLYASNAAVTTTTGGLLCRSESASHINFADATDPADATHRFDAAMVALATVSGGGTPVSGTRYASGAVHLGTPTSDMRIDMPTPQALVAMWFIDNDASSLRLRAFDASGLVLDSLTVAQVGEGGRTFRGFEHASADISYVIIDGPNGAAIDSTFIDDVTTSTVPTPAAAALMAAGGIVMARRRRTTR